jgi:hypothetical protein
MASKQKSIMSSRSARNSRKRGLQSISGSPAPADAATEFMAPFSARGCFSWLLKELRLEEEEIVIANNTSSRAGV